MNIPQIITLFILLLIPPSWDCVIGCGFTCGRDGTSNCCGDDTLTSCCAVNPPGQPFNCVCCAEGSNACFVPVIPASCSFYCVPFNPVNCTPFPACPAHCAQCGNNLNCLQCADGYSGEYCQQDDAMCALCVSSAKILVDAALSGGGASCVEIGLKVWELCVPALAETLEFDPVICTGLGVAASVFCELGFDKATTNGLQNGVCATQCSAGGVSSELGTYKLLAMSNSTPPLWPPDFAIIMTNAQDASTISITLSNSQQKLLWSTSPSSMALMDCTKGELIYSSTNNCTKSTGTNCIVPKDYLDATVSYLLNSTDYQWKNATQYSWTASPSLSPVPISVIYNVSMADGVSPASFEVTVAGNLLSTLIVKSWIMQHNPISRLLLVNVQ